MKIQAYLEREKKKKVIELQAKALVKDALTKLDINPITVIVTKENELITEEHQLKDNDKIKVISVVSGG